MSDAALRLEQVSIVLAGRVLIAPLTEVIAPGAVLTLMGPSGSGKSTLVSFLGGTLRCPLTATVFAVELTGDLKVMPAVIVACAASFAVTVLLMRRSILTERLARRGRHLTYEYTVDPFEVMRVRDIMAHPVHTLAASLSMSDTLAFFQAESGVTRHRSYPVVDDAAHVIGMVSRSDVLRWSREGWRVDETLGEQLNAAELLVAYPEDRVGELADRMIAADVGRVPIIERGSGALVGLVARRDLLRVRAHAGRLERERAQLMSFH